MLLVSSRPALHLPSLGSWDGLGGLWTRRTRCGWQCLSSVKVVWAEEWQHPETEAGGWDRDRRNGAWWRPAPPPGADYRIAAHSSSWWPPGPLPEAGLGELRLQQWLSLLLFPPTVVGSHILWLTRSRTYYYFSFICSFIIIVNSSQ